MDNKRLISMMLLFFAVMFGWRMYVDFLYTKHPEWQKPGDTATTQPTPATSRSTTYATTSSTMPATQSSGNASMQTSALQVIPATNPTSQPSAITLGNGPNDRMAVQLTPIGAGVDSVTLPDFKGIDAKGAYVFQTPYDAADPNTRSMATRAIIVNGNTLNIAGERWTLESSDAHSATFSLDCGLVRVRKTYELTDKSAPGLGYELKIRHTVENKTSQPVNVSIVFAGPTTPPRETERGPDLQILGGYDNGYEKVVVDHHMVEEFSTKAPFRDMTKGPDNAPILWAGTASVYFNALVRPEPLDTKTVSPKYITKIEASALNPDSEPIDRRVMVTFTADAAIPASGSVTIPTTTFLGPRWRQVLNEPHYASFPLGFDSTLVLTSGPCAYCTFGWLINGLVWLLNAFHWLFGGFAHHGDWGLAIIGLVVLVRLILHPITKRSQVSMMRMGKMGPEMERLKKKYADDKDELNRQMMAMYKDQGIGAYLGCAPMFLQMPIWIALWSALQSTFELRQSPFLWGFTWIHDLAKPDHLVTWNPIIIPSQIWVIGGAHISGFNLLPVLLAVVFFLQQKYTPKPPAQTPEQETQQKMMLWMSVLLFPIIVYSGPAGLNLYILTSTTIGIIESKRIRAHIKQKEEEEKAGKVIIDAPKSLKRKRDDDDFGSGAKRTSQPKKPQGGFSGWIAQMQAKAEELRKQVDKDRK